MESRHSWGYRARGRGRRPSDRHVGGTKETTSNTPHRRGSGRYANSPRQRCQREHLGKAVRRSPGHGVGEDAATLKLIGTRSSGGDARVRSQSRRRSGGEVGIVSADLVGGSDDRLADSYPVPPVGGRLEDGGPHRVFAWVTGLPQAGRAPIQPTAMDSRRPTVRGLGKAQAPLRPARGDARPRSRT